MILITACAKALKKFLDQKVASGEILKFRIYVRLGFRLDAYIFVPDVERATGMKKEFLDSTACKNQDVDLKFYVHSQEELDDPYYRAVKDGNNDIDDGPRFRFDSFLNKQYSTQEPTGSPKTSVPVITFYSYKGGMGRTTTMMAYAIYLAEKYGKKVAVVDCDLEAPGYLNFFGLEKNEELLNCEKNGFVEYACDCLSSENADSIDIRDYVVQAYAADAAEKEGKVWVVPAGNLNEDIFKSGTSSNHRDAYLEGLAKLNLSNSQMMEDIFSQLFKKLGDLKVDVILLDSRTGFNDIFGYAVLKLSKSVVGFFGRSRQTEPGFMNLLQLHKNSNGKFNLHIAYSIWPEGDYHKPSSMYAYIMHLYSGDCKAICPDESFIHRDRNLEYIGAGDEEKDEEFKNKIREIEKNNDLEDYRRLFYSIDADLDLGRGNQENGISPSDESLIYDTLEKALGLFFKRNGTDDASLLIERECEQQISEKKKFLFYGNDGCGKTMLFQKCKNRVDEKFFFVKVSCSQFDELICTPEGELHWESFGSSYAFWQAHIWDKLLTIDECEVLNEIRKDVCLSSKLWNDIQREKDNEGSVFCRPLDESEIGDVERDLFSFDGKLNEKDIRVAILFDGLDGIKNLQKKELIVSSLVKFWQLNNESFDRIFPKILIDEDFEHSIGVDFEKVLNIEKFGVDMKWNVEELFRFMNSLVGDEKYGSILEHLIFGEQILIDGINRGRPRDFVGRLFSGGSGKYVQLYPFALMLNELVKEKGWSNKKTLDVAKKYFEHICELNDCNLCLLEDVLRHEGKELACRIMNEDMFERLVLTLSRNDSYEYEKWKSCLIRSGIVDKVIPGGKIILKGFEGVRYCFAPIFWDLWNLAKV